MANIFLCIPVPTKRRTVLQPVVDTKQPMTSLFEQSLFLLGDIIAQIIIQYKNIDKDELWKFHANLE
jgi:6-phospho-3-hexuloisomerase